MGPLDLLLLPVRTAAAVTLLPERLDRLSEGLDAVRDDASAMRRQFEEVARVVDRLAGDVAPMDEDLAEVTRAVEAMAPQMREVRDHIDLLREDLSGLPFVGKS